MICTFGHTGHMLRPGTRTAPGTNAGHMFSIPRRSKQKPPDFSEGFVVRGHHSEHIQSLLCYRYTIPQSGPSIVPHDQDRSRGMPRLAWAGKRLLVLDDGQVFERSLPNAGKMKLSTLGLEPRTYGLKVRCSTN